MADSAPIAIQVAYAAPGEQHLIDLQVAPGTTVAEAVRASGLPERVAGADPDRAALGVYGRVVEADRAVQAGDRVEVYRPLELDPREARRQRASLGRDEA